MAGATHRRVRLGLDAALLAPSHGARCVQRSDHVRRLRGRIPLAVVLGLQALPWLAQGARAPRQACEGKRVKRPGLCAMLAGTLRFQHDRNANAQSVPKSNTKN
eukprot:462501-Prymnesium_polylepis.1